MWSYRLHFFKLTQALFVTACLLASGMALAEERILNYHSGIQVHTNGSLAVTETIRVRAEGNNIRRGIYRDFPTRYKDRFGNHYRVDFEVLEVQRDGAPEPFSTENRSNGVRVYIGNANQMLEPGIHEYRLRFHTNRQLGFFDDYDELYWNVTGNGWVFPIDHASARIELPAEVQPGDLRTIFFTGPQGATGKQAQVNIIDARTIDFETTAGLAAYEGLTVAVGWPKGIVTEPSTRDKITYFLRDNGSSLVLLAGLLVTLGWYLWAWNRYGRDPQKGVIIPRFHPPKGLTAAACSYIRKMSFTKQAFSAAIISLGVKGYLDIREDDDEFSLYEKPLPAHGKASKGELGLVKELFSDGPTIELKQENYRVFMKAESALKRALKAEHLGRVFNLNSAFALPAVIVSILTVILAAQMSGGAIGWIIFIVLSVAMHIGFLFLLKAPTPAGRKIMDEIDGFKMYLDTAEQERLEHMQSPQLTPEVFETFLPYAFALGVENNWCDRFSREFPAELAEQGGYHPSWYIGSHVGLSSLGHLGNQFSSSFSSAISSASTAPGSSSGSGGSSGGGGGGGGGGGW